MTVTVIEPGDGGEAVAGEVPATQAEVIAADVAEVHADASVEIAQAQADAAVAISENETEARAAEADAAVRIAEAAVEAHNHETELEAWRTRALTAEAALLSIQEQSREPPPNREPVAESLDESAERTQALPEAQEPVEAPPAAEPPPPKRKAIRFLR